jgi:hypothetical protein
MWIFFGLQLVDVLLLQWVERSKGYEVSEANDNQLYFGSGPDSFRYIVLHNVGTTLVYWNLPPKTTNYQQI